MVTIKYLVTDGQNDVDSGSSVYSMLVAIEYIYCKCNVIV